MRCLNEHIARMSNREDDCKGRFWEGRFKCQRLLDEGALLACMAYVDLNPIRAKVATTLESSRHTSVHDRITAHQAKSSVKHLQEQRKSKSLTQAQARKLQEKQESGKAADWLASIGSGSMPLTLEEYLQVLDWTGRQLRAGKRGKIADEIKPILTRLQIDHNNWLKTIDSYGSLFCRVAGSVPS